MKLLGIKASNTQTTERNSYWAKVEEEITLRAKQFVSLRDNTLEQLNNWKEDLTHPYKDMKKTYDEAYARAIKLKKEALQKAKALLDAEAEKLAREEEVSTLTELQRLNSFKHFENILKTLSTMQIYEYGNGVELTETEYFQIRAELTSRINTANENEANEIRTFLTAFKQTDAESYLEQAYNELRLMENNSDFPMLPMYLQVQQQSIAQLLGEAIVNEAYTAEHGRQLTVDEQIDEFFK